MTKVDGLRKIRIGFIIICIALSLPTLLLSSYVFHTKSSLIELAQEEIRGTKKIAELVDSLSNTKDAKVTLFEIRDVGDKYKIVLDQSMDIHYVTVVTLHRLPLMFRVFEQLKAEQGITGEVAARVRLQLQGNMENQISESARAIKLAHLEDPNYYGHNQKLSSGEYDIAYENLVRLYRNSFKTERPEDIQASLDATINFWKLNLDVLESLELQKIAQLESSRAHDTEMTLGFWIASLTVVILFGKAQLDSQNKLRTALEEQNLRLNVASKMSAIGEMSAGIAHEINTPLAAIRLNAEMIVENADLGELSNEDGKQLGSTVIQVVDQISRIIMSMRKVSRHDIFDVPRAENFGAILGDVLVLCGSNLKKNGVTLSAQVADDLWITCRQVEIAQVLINLINNAIDACAPSQEKKVMIVAERVGSEIVVRIEDSGPRIADEVRNRLFKETFTTKATGKGTGLGLQIVGNIMKSYGGSIKLSDQSTTCFELQLPSTQPEAA